jgi:myo-inositol 2-dehydrogenase / D-chiro-inositol 1-dehydrogenase
MAVPRPCFAIFGLGRAGHFHLTALTTMHNVRLKYVMDVNKELADQVAKKYGSIACYDVETIVNDPEVTAVVVSSATHAHFHQIQASLKAGKAVFTEKPISFNENELREVIEFAIECKVPFFVGFQRRIDHNFATMRAMVREGKIGQVSNFIIIFIIR